MFTFLCNKKITNTPKMVCIQLQVTYRFCRYLAIHSSFKNKHSRSSQRFVYICLLFCNENITNCEKFVYHSIQGHLNISHAKFHLPPINQSKIAKIPKNSVKSLEVSTSSRQEFLFLTPAPISRKILPCHKSSSRREGHYYVLH